MKGYTIHDLAADLQISSTTVWRALQGHARISQATKERVLARAREMNYVPSQVAQNLSHGRTQTLGVIVPAVGHPVFSALVETIESQAFERGYNVILCDTRLDLEREAQYARMLLSRRVEGVVLVPFAKRAADWEQPWAELLQRQIPVVLVEQDLSTAITFPKVVADNFGAARAMTQHLIDKGHRRIAFAFHPVHSWDSVGNERLAGFNQAMRDAGLSSDARLILDAAVFEGEAALWRYQPEEILQAFQKEDRPTALFAGMDMLAIRAMETLRSAGLRIPEDVAVAGFDNVEFSDFTVPPLTTVQQPITAMGCRAVQILLKAIEDKEDAGGVHPGNGTASGVELQIPKRIHDRLPCELIIRQSCGTHLKRSAGGHD
ncbi:MAG: LacI family DNA-binding transcriptional regulator [Candidatus Methylacidiphilales bacterium]|nr:LacI family DNA-binding transcriptional regulator [Candidatus Methylacidiphilales bacterium]